FLQPGAHQSLDVVALDGEILQGGEHGLAAQAAAMKQRPVRNGAAIGPANEIDGFAMRRIERVGDESLLGGDVAQDRDESNGLAELDEVSAVRGCAAGGCAATGPRGGNVESDAVDGVLQTAPVLVGAVGGAVMSAAAQTQAAHDDGLELAMTDELHLVI